MHLVTLLTDATKKDKKTKKNRKIASFLMRIKKYLPLSSLFITTASITIRLFPMTSAINLMFSDSIYFLNALGVA
jgi:hypothetical protein